MLTPPWVIPINQLLRGAEKTISLPDMLALHQVATLDPQTDRSEKPVFLQNLARIDPEQLQSVNSRYGEQGLFQVAMLAKTQTFSDFDYLWRSIADSLSFQDILGGGIESGGQPHARFPEWDNASIHPGPALDRFNHNVVNARISRQLYSPGVKPGYIVHGLGGPRMLVSHPFRGVGRFTYDIYANTLDVVTSLGVRGWYGSFLFLDRLEGLEEQVHGVPAWAAWFSLIAAQSDAVLFIKQHEGNFGPSQELEMALTPARVNRKLIEIPADELQWAAVAGDGDVPVVSFGRDGKAIPNSEFDMQVVDQSHANQLLPLYCDGGFPRNKLIRVAEDGGIAEYPSSVTGY